jgi:thiosulfate/3-mercaptopyruvate sulfurtransferase
MNSDISGAPLSRRKAIRMALCALAAPAVSFFPSGLCLLDAGATAATPRPAQAPGARDSAADIPLARVLEPNQLAALLSQPGEKPTIICVGFKFLYDAAHIPSSRYFGPGREGNGIVALAKWAANAPKNKTVVLYCGCCPWAQCPNIQPAYVALKNMAFTQIKVLRINQNFGADWVDKGFPTEKKKQ